MGHVSHDDIIQMDEVCFHLRFRHLWDFDKCLDRLLLTSFPCFCYALKNEDKGSNFHSCQTVLSSSPCEQTGCLIVKLAKLLKSIACQGNLSHESLTSAWLLALVR